MSVKTSNSKHKKSKPTPMDEDHGGPLHDRKGGAIRFLKGKYAGRPGWLDTMKEETDEMVYVIVQLKKKNRLKDTRVYKRNIKMGEAEPATNYEEACLQQHEDIDRVMEQLVSELAKCELLDTTVCARVFKLRLEDAISRQTERGYKARWRKVDWEEEEFADL